MGERRTAVQCLALALIAGALSACAQLETTFRDALAAVQADHAKGDAPKPPPAALAAPKTAKAKEDPPKPPPPAREDDISVEEMAVHHAMDQIGKRYRTGGNSPKAGFDAAGLIHYSYAKAGVRVPRTAAEQREASGRVLLANLRLGDLVYFDIDGKKHAHVGLYIGDGRFVHASASGRSVRMSRLDTPYWRERVSEARRLDPRPSAGR